VAALLRDFGTMTTTACETAPLGDAILLPGFCSFAFPVQLDRPRSVVSVGTSNRLLALERGNSSVLLLEDQEGDGIPESRRTLVTVSGLNHGLAIHSGYIYASSSDVVYRWPYTGNFEVVEAEPTVVINNMNDNGQGSTAAGNHVTRTLIFDNVGRLYVSVGSTGNVDTDSVRSRVRRFSLDDESSFPVNFTSGEVFADGLRNEVGLAFDQYGVLWGVENGADNLFREDLGGVIYNDNPAEELHQFLEEGGHYGYPYCWTEYSLEDPYGLGRGTVWAWPSFLSDGTISDEQCRANYKPAALAMQAHSAPLGIVFYQWRPSSERPSQCQDGAFPQSMDGFAFIAYHGSWNRQVPTGYKVVYVAMDELGNAIGEPVDLLAHTPPDARWDDGFRPVDVDFDECGRLIVSSDGTGTGSKIVRIEYGASGDVNAPSVAPNDISDIPSVVPPAMPSSLPTFEQSTPSISSAPRPELGFWLCFVFAALKYFN